MTSMTRTKARRLTRASGNGAWRKADGCLGRLALPALAEANLGQRQRRWQGGQRQGVGSWSTLTGWRKAAQAAWAGVWAAMAGGLAQARAGRRTSKQGWARPG